MTELPACAILDDYQNVALSVADWSSLDGRIEVRRFGYHLGGEADISTELADFSVVIAMRERTPFPGSLLRRLPRLKLLVTTGSGNRSIDLDAARALGITVCGTGSAGNQTAELAWAGILAFKRRLPEEVANFRSGGPWQSGLGRSVAGKRLGIVGLGKLGERMACLGQAFGMDVCGWNRSNPEGRAAELGIEPVTLPRLFESCDIVTIHLTLTPETQQFVTAELLAKMKPDAVLVNTSRGAIVDEGALVEVLRYERIAGAVLDVYHEEPLPANHPLRSLHNVIATPHIGYVTLENYEVYYSHAVEAVSAWLDGIVVRELT